jgi:hypothetical protein
LLIPYGRAAPCSMNKCNPWAINRFGMYGIV